MTRSTITRSSVALAGASLIFAGALVVSGALANDPPVTVPSTGEEPIGTPGTVTLPTPVWETPETVVELPSTGVGSAAQ